MTFKLTSPRDAAIEMARVFLGSETATIEVSEDKCFAPGTYWNLGSVTLDGANDQMASIVHSLRRGAFEWDITPYDAAMRSLAERLQLSEPNDRKQREQYERAMARLPRIMDGVATAAARLGLILPIFDSQSVEDMPFKQGTTVIADTSGVLQGGLDFVSTFLHPAARIKIPAVVHMEVVNQADNFLKRRRALKSNGSALLLDHILSQTGQRALLRLELRADTEVERSLLVGDPLRNAFQRDTDAEWNDLQLSVPLRSYCDRLILEAARQHQSQSNPGHRLQLLTCDQGFARMALAEGVSPLYFRAVKADSFFGHRLTGTRFHPFRPALHRVALPDVLWELATAFGSARIASPNGERWVEIAAFGEELTWSPVHSQNDLLWMRGSGLPEAPTPPATSRGEPPASVEATSKIPLKSRPVPARKPARPKAEKPASPGFYRFNVERMFNLIIRLAEEGRLSEARAYVVADTKDDRGFSEFRRFLLSGGLATRNGDDLEPTEAGVALATALRESDAERIALGLSEVPSVGQFFARLAQAELGKPLALDLPERAEVTYRTLAEVSLLACSIPQEGYYPTPTTMTLRDFVEIALRRFGDLESGDGLVSVGAWLEALVRLDGVHPERSRRYLDEAQASGLINRSTEGSTTDTRHDQHAVRVLRSGSAGVKIETVHLYRGDFLIPNKSSSSLRLGAVQ